MEPVCELGPEPLRPESLTFASEWPKILAAVLIIVFILVAIVIYHFADERERQKQRDVALRSEATQLEEHLQTPRVTTLMLVGSRLFLRDRCSRPLTWKFKDMGAWRGLLRFLVMRHWAIGHIMCSNELCDMAPLVKRQLSRLIYPLWFFNEMSLTRKKCRLGLDWRGVYVKCTGKAGHALAYDNAFERFEREVSEQVPRHLNDCRAQLG